MTTIQIAGAGGLLGRQVAGAARARGWDVIDTPLDITVATPDSIQCDLVINCAAITDRKAPQCKTVAVNSLGPHVLAGICSHAGARLVHISTDMVFCGPGPHTESDKPDATDFHALAKLFGEVAYSPHVTIRTSIVGLNNRGLMKDILTAKPTSPVIASNKLLWNGVSATTCAEIVLDIAVRRDITGILHVPGHHTSRWELCRVLAGWLGVTEDRLRRDDSFVADRRLSSERWEQLGLAPISPFDEQLKKVERWYDGSDQRSDSSRATTST